MTTDMREAARQHIAEHGLGADEQTRICLFLMAIKNANVMILAKVELQPMEWMPYSLLHHQFFTELELFTPLFRATRWTTDPLVYTRATRFNLVLWQKAGISKYLYSHFSLDQRFFEYLALSYAFMSEVRFMPLLPPDRSRSDPFVSSLERIESESERMVQSHGGMLREIEVEMSEIDRERAVVQRQAVVRELFDEFLAIFSGVDR